VWESWIAAAAWRNETKVRDSRMVGNLTLRIMEGLPVIRPQFRLTLDYTPGCRIALNVQKQQYAL
jgi:hypothetical protein